MIALPLPLVLSLILGFLALRMVLRGRPVPMIAGLLALLALQALINALALHYTSPAARFIQPVTAMAIPALAWLAWTSDGLGRPLTPRDALHAAGPLLALALRWQGGFFLELLVPLTYAAYATALALTLNRAGPDLPRTRLGQGGTPHLLWGGIALALALSALSDFGIALAMAAGHAARVPLIVDIATTALLLGIGTLALAAERLTARTDDQDSATAPVATEDDHALMARLNDLMESRHLWRDPDLTLAKLARRLQVPAKRLSTAVNRATGDNISRLVNGYRIRAACDALARGATATEAMLDAGILTKSNFNREFRRITGQTPTQWQAAHRQP
ncbi:helix-turn-helix domain-containing protein [Fuscovulum ytuae]|uniref:AraC family transcriptional regulator n=1 Tax=Fuscovulum ytuae TaxID=3042299 RepID=A0ABY8Q4Q5_9RHOB|nr:AraC family transcriptional regulator [Fuscovulum sp. YMD61]WGV15853.1 AraC family transcriptional regulator [Fuscovulum sp. YMD61]